ncbi:late histone H2A.2.2-like [Tiliqua scincoides]|uniref:late histone H2A.2.2-like n=1 Tax=Tiliqua scincoides TaxID=71010 RepID=UPI003462FEE5
MANSSCDDAEDYEDMEPSSRSKRPKTSRSYRAGLIFPVGRIDRFLRRGEYAERIGSGASVYMAAVLQYLIYDIVDMSGTMAARDKKRRISPKHLQWTIKNDVELHSLLGDVVLPQGKATRKARKSQAASSSKKGKGKKSCKSTKAPKAVAA